MSEDREVRNLIRNALRNTERIPMSEVAIRDTLIRLANICERQQDRIEQLQRKEKREC